MGKAEVVVDRTFQAMKSGVRPNRDNGSGR